VKLVMSVESIYRCLGLQLWLVVVMVVVVLEASSRAVREGKRFTGTDGGATSHMVAQTRERPCAGSIFNLNRDGSGSTKRDA
jgi:ABC-type cobalt transport system substrate-binding protein